MRVYIILAEESVEFFLSDFPGRPMAGDYFEGTLFENSPLGKKSNQILETNYYTSFVYWTKDEKGIYLKVYLTPSDE